MSTIRKQFIAEEIRRPAGAGDRVRRFVISTAAVDRDNDTIAVSGWKLDAYRRNPVVLWAHDYSQLPIARALSVGVENGRLVATAEFAEHEFAETVLRLIDGGFLRATSVGFRPIKRTENRERGGYDYVEQELVEYSVVPVPANADALVALGGKAPAPATDATSMFTYEEIAQAYGDVIAAERQRRRAADPTAAHRVFEVDERALALMVADVVRQSIRDIAGQSVRDAVNRLRGRVD